MASDVTFKQPYLNGSLEKRHTAFFSDSIAEKAAAELESLDVEETPAVYAIIERLAKAHAQEVINPDGPASARRK